VLQHVAYALCCRYPGAVKMNLKQGIFVLRKIKPRHVIVIDGLLRLLLSKSAQYISVLQHSDSVENFQTDLSVKPVPPRNVVVDTYLKVSCCI
jgi:hypothetical protein